MLRLIFRANCNKICVLENIKTTTTVITSRSSSKCVETPEEYDKRYEAYFNRPDIDGWEIRKGLHDIHGDDLIPDPIIICAALKACRRVSDYALGVRILETVKYKCGPQLDRIYPYILQEIRPTLEELGLDTPEQLGYDKPELALVDVDDIH